ncbi:MAG: hypothetical protein M0R73_11960 [Dehalococcoidia bacterium]|nr:hypothetical protein [Dehalococcoidia bacterium]
MDISRTQPTPPHRGPSPASPGVIARLPRRLAVLLGAALLGLLLVACDGSEGGPIPTATGGTGSTGGAATGTSTEVAPPTPTSTPSGSPTTSPTPATTPTPAPTPTLTPSESLRSLLLSVISTGVTAAEQAALDQMEVVAIELQVADRDLWAAVTSGPGVWELGNGARQVVAIYERRTDGSWVEVAVLPLESEPTRTDIEVVPAPAGSDLIWLAVHGNTGAHAGTFELVRFDGVALTSSLWWFSPSPGAATIADLDGDGAAEIVLDATDPYVYCYACGVRAWGEIIYRWVDGEPEAVNIGPIESSDPRVRVLTEQAARLVEADLWRRARSTMQLALEAAPDVEAVWWMALTIGRTADARLADAGLEWQPLTTAVLAGEYTLALDLMDGLPPAQMYAPDGPLLAGTVAEDWPEVMGEILVDYATRALDVDSTMAEAYAVRSLGRILAAPDDWEGARLDMDAALAIEPGNPFYQQADAFLLTLYGGTRG